MFNEDSTIYEVIQYRWRNGVLSPIYATSQRYPLSYRDAKTLALSLSKEAMPEWPGCYAEIAPLGISVYESDERTWYFSGRESDRPNLLIQMTAERLLDLTSPLTMEAENDESDSD